MVREDDRVRLTELWVRLRAVFGTDYAESLATDQVLGELDGRTISDALAAGVEAKEVWRAVVATFDVPARLR